MTRHYEEAERLLAQYNAAIDASKELSELLSDAGVSTDDQRSIARDLVAGSSLILQEAQVHATLATMQGV